MLAALLGAGLPPRDLTRYLHSASGAALLLDVRTRRLLGVCNQSTAAGWLAPPGSTLKPFALAALLRAGKLTAAEAYPCPRRLRIGGRVFDCVHPPLDIPLRVDTALAYSCNCFVAHMAERFAPGDLARDLQAAGLASRTGLLGDAEAAGQVRPAAPPDACRMQALGEQDVLVTAAGLALAYRRLALGVAAPVMEAIAAGLEGAVEYGTAQSAHVAGATVAGKTGSVRNAAGARIAWFAGFLPSRTPEVVVTVMLQGRSGGADAAPVAGRILEAYQAGRL